MMDPATVDLDPGIRDLYRRAINKSMGGKPDNPVKQARYYVMHQLAEGAMRRFPLGDVVEVGCWKGHSTLIIANLMQQHCARVNRPTFHIYDSFEGLSPFAPEDKSSHRKPQDADPRKYATNPDTLAALLGPLGFVHLHHGWIPVVFWPDDLNTVSFANIDVNLYEPTRDSLKFVYPKLLPGSVIFFDDYGYKTCPGATKAIDDVIAALPVTERPAMFVALPFGSAFLVR